MSTLPKGPFFKVLKGNVSPSGGNPSYLWKLPQGDQPGEWNTETTPIRVCAHGLHVTNAPLAWYQHGCEVYLVEIDGQTHGYEGHDKIACERVRLLRKLTDAELVAHHILVSGEHEVRDGVWFASGSATVTAYDSATVTAYGSATVTAYGSATVRAEGHSTVIQWGHGTTVKITGNAARVDRRNDRVRCYRAKPEGSEGDEAAS